MTAELLPQNCLQRRLACSFVNFWDFSLSVSCVACQSSHNQTTELVQLRVSRSLTTVFSIDLALKTTSVQPKTVLCILHTCNLYYLNVIVPVSEVSTFDYSNHLKCSSPAQTRSSLVIKVFISTVKSFHFQHEMFSSLPINMFVCNVIRIWRRVAKTILSLVMNKAKQS